MIILVAAGAFYYASQKIEYVWRWNRVPIYFAYKDDIQITSDIDGDVESITTGDKESIITIKGLDESESYKAPAVSVSVEEGEMVSIGDTLAEYQKWKPGLLIIGLWITLQISVIATILGVIIGIIGGLARISSNPAFRWLTIIYVEIIRGSPLMVQILIWYFVLGTVINELLASSGMGRLPAFWYAARSLGMSYAQSMLYIILPQALRRILPPLAGQFISLIKDSSLLGMIAIRELTKAAREAVTVSLQPFEVFFLAAALYLVLTFTLSMVVQRLEKRMAFE